MDARKSTWLIPSLGLTQIVGWGSMFYAYGILMQPMQTELQLSKPVVVGAYSLALLISGLMSTLAGSIIDRIGGRLLMGAGTVLAALMLAAMSFVHDALGLYLIWAVIGLAMSATLYQPAFAVLTQVFKADFRRAITMLTLFGGFASTVAWPLTQWLLEQYGWRTTWQIYAVANLVICLPVHMLLPAARSIQKTKAAANKDWDLKAVLRQPSFYAVTAAVTLNALVFSAMSLHLMSILHDRGMTPYYAAAIGAMIGPMQVLGRILETTIGKKASTKQTGQFAISLLPVALLLLYAPADWLVLYGLFAILYGMGNGVMTIVRGTLPAELYGREAYGAISGAMATPVTIAFAAGPFVASLLYSVGGGYPGAIVALVAIAATGAILFFFATAAIRPQSEPISQ
ncbi:MAG: MFS transporter [Herbaspirillum sp.]|uniref:MFS transporter n=1 Tax=Herbaspirillum sp. TaxID=1890675 RepID=UPI00258DE0CC|nr:MFS transporter [Herbaspirillum sp.]MCP3656723.1 MFS transporter [Herbaspirillum sp.]MCP3950477.1 MFS transporter [Herbaspirillum sp.]MCP4031011.1 MFS transporter [Herbaspirillum sp.]